MLGSTRPCSTPWSVTSFAIASTDGNDDNITVDVSPLFPIAFSVDGGGGNNSLTLSGLTHSSTWTYNGSGGGTAVAGGSDFGTISFANIGTIAADGPYTLIGPTTQSAWTIDGTDQGSVEGFSFSGFDAIVGSGNGDSVVAPTAASGGSVLGVSYSAVNTPTVGAVDTATWQAPSGTTAITLADDGTNVGVTYVNPSVNSGNPTTLDFAPPTSELAIETSYIDRDDRHVTTLHRAVAACRRQRHQRAQRAAEPDHLDDHER